MKHTYKYDHYYLYSEIEEILKTWIAKCPSYTKLETIGTTYEGRNIYVMAVTDTRTGDFSEKPAFYTEGNIHAGEVTGSMSVMLLMDTLLSNTDDPEIARLLEKNTFYILPRVSPDGSEHYLTTPETLRSSKRPYPFLQEMPGLQPRDLDGDGVIRTMRVKSPYGMWKVSPLDDRLMTKRLPDDVDGDFYDVYTEGEILDYDGLTVKPAPAKYSYDFNRNYPVDWKPAWVQRGAGETSLCNPETQANAKFLMAHKDQLCCCIDMHTHGGLVLYTPGSQSAKNADPEDIKLYKTIGLMGAEETGYPLLNVYDDFSPQSDPATYGGFDDFCHFIIGIPAFTIECWDIEARSGIERSIPPKENMSEEERRENEYKMLKWIDANLPEGEGFMPWTAFEHPQLGTVEIGGINVKFIYQNPPKSFLEEDITKHVNFMLRAVKAFPRVIVEKAEAEKLADGLYRVSAVIGNRGFLPSYVFNQALKDERMPEMTAALTGAEVVEGGEEVKFGHLAGYGNQSMMTWGFPATTVHTKPMEKKITWIVRGKAGSKLTITVTGDRTGVTKAEITL